jgi:hypothetical protein
VTPSSYWSFVEASSTAGFDIAPGGLPGKAGRSPSDQPFNFWPVLQSRLISRTHRWRPEDRHFMFAATPTRSSVPTNVATSSRKRRRLTRAWAEYCENSEQVGRNVAALGAYPEPSLPERGVMLEYGGPISHEAG